MSDSGTGAGSNADKVVNSDNTDIPVRQVERRMIRTNKAPEIPPFESRNWLIHSHYMSKDFDTCRSLIVQQLAETQGMCEYAQYVQGMVLRQEGRIHESLESLQVASRLNPQNPENLKQIARSLFLMGKHKTAIEVYSSALQLIQSRDPENKDWEILHNQGICYARLGDSSAAKNHLKKAIDIGQQHSSYMQLGRVHLEEGNMDQAISVYKEALAISAEDAELMTTLGLLYLRNNKHQEAFEYLGNSLAYSPTEHKAILAVGSVMQKHQDHDVAISKYRVATLSTPESPQLWNNIGMCFFDKKKYVIAVSCLKRSWYLAPFEWRITYNLGLIHLTIRQYASAVHFLRAAISTNSRLGESYLLLGIALNHLKEQSQAKQAFEHSLTLIPDNISLLLNYSIFLLKSADSKSALYHFTKCESLITSSSLKTLDPDLVKMSGQLGSVLRSELPDKQEVAT